jgi:MFS family permease
MPVAMNLLLAPTVNAALFALMLRSTPEEMRGRVSNTVVMVATALATLAPLTAGLLVQHVSGAWAIGAFAATMAVAAVLSLFLPGLHQMEPPRGRGGLVLTRLAGPDGPDPADGVKSCCVLRDTVRTVGRHVFCAWEGCGFIYI